MKSRFSARLLAFSTFFAVLAGGAKAASAGEVDTVINTYVAPVASQLAGVIFFPLTIFGHEVPFIILWLMAIGIFSSFYMGFINLRCFGLAFRLLGGDFQAKDKQGEISNWQALATSLSGTVGLGNIAGVAVAVSMGGPGATVWMILMGLLGMTTKFIECALGVKYRKIDENGVCSGGPMYYIHRGLAERGWPRLGSIMAGFFAVCCIGGAIGAGNMFQSNQSYSMYMRMAGEGSFFADKGWLFGLGLAVLTGAVILGGIKSIAKISEKIFPAMAVLYIAACLGIIIVNFDAFPPAISTIIHTAFSPDAAVGGMIGALIAGVRRAVFSNEAGAGSAAITYAAVQSDSHIAQGLISMLNPFIDTVVICTMTALAIAVTGVYEQGQNVEGVALTARAFATMGDWSIYLLGFVVFLFAYSTLISWYYLGEKAFCYLAGDGNKKKMAFKLVYCLCVILGAALNLSAVIDLSDALFFAMALPNVFVLYVMAPEIRRDLKVYLEKIHQG